FNIQGALQDPTLAVGSGSNDNWKIRDNPAGESQEAQVQATGLAPTDNREAVYLAGFTSSNYSSILRGKNNTTGIGVIEAYQTDQDSTAELGNISSRGFIEGADNVMIGGFILGGGASAKIIVRAIGPSLAAFGIANPVSDPTLSLRNGNGTQIAFNDDWKSNQETEIAATTLPPSNDFESAIVTTLPAGTYTAIVAGSTARGGTGTGVGLVEIYNLQY
ncbi:MAG TPA: DVUA0089 family protein, partial [Chthoniobacterales bacterium]|nr:DVUA0089 family protein [Chthoniobacterales bacterium]